MPKCTAMTLATESKLLINIPFKHVQDGKLEFSRTLGDNVCLVLDIVLFISPN